MITDAAGSLVRVDPDTNAVVAEVTVPAAPRASPSRATRSGWRRRRRTSGDPRQRLFSNVVEETVKVGPRRSPSPSGEGSVWTLNGGDGTRVAHRSEDEQGDRDDQVGAIGTSGTILVGEGSVWVSTPGFPLSRIDPRTNRLAQQFTGPGGGVLAIGLKSHLARGDADARLAHRSEEGRGDAEVDRDGRQDRAVARRRLRGAGLNHRKPSTAVSEELLLKTSLHVFTTSW